jgi:hypothetical protein
VYDDNHAAQITITEPSTTQQVVAPNSHRPLAAALPQNLYGSTGFYLDSYDAASPARPPSNGEMLNFTQLSGHSDVFDHSIEQEQSGLLSAAQEWAVAYLHSVGVWITWSTILLVCAGNRLLRLNQPQPEVTAPPVSPAGQDGSDGLLIGDHLVDEHHHDIDPSLQEECATRRNGQEQEGPAISYEYLR